MKLLRGHHVLWAASTLAIGALGLSGANAQAAEPAAKGSSASEKIEASEIIVTATKRDERLREVAGGISAVTGPQLERIGAQDYRDYLTRLPGVAFNEGPPSNSTAVIRGVGTTAGLDQGQGTTGYFINDIALAEPGYAVVIPDIDAFDVARVEVLRGPQGSLFGSASLGGAINYISNLADPAQFDAAGEFGVSSTDNSSNQFGYRAKGMINAPLIGDKLAVRLTGTQRVDPGYIDNVGTGIDGANDVRNTGLRGSIAFTPDAATKLTYLGLYYKTKSDDASYAELNIGPMARSSAFPVGETFATQIHSLRLDHDFGGGYDFTAIAAYNAKKGDVLIDYAPYTGFVAPGAIHRFLQAGTSDVYSFEGRLASPKGAAFDWLIGATAIDTTKRFEEHLSSPGLAAVLPSSLLLTGDEYYFGAGDTKGLELALFGEGNLHFGPVTITAGGRLFNNKQTRSSEQYGPIFFAAPNIVSALTINDSGFAPKISVKYQVSPDLMFYTLAAKGFRFGQPNLGLIPVPGFITPDGTKSDSLWSYEVGTRISLADRKVLLDLTGFYIDWKDIQVRLVRPDNLSYGANAGGATIKGVEATLAVNLGGFSYNFNGTYLDAAINETIPAFGGPIPDGTTLPSSAKWRLSNTTSYNFGGSANPTLTLLHRYVSKSPGYLNQPLVFPSYHIFDTRASIDIATVTVSAFVNNIGNKRAVTFGYGGSPNGLTQFYVRPRTFGLQLNWRLK